VSQVETGSFSTQEKAVQFGIVYGSDDDTELGWGEVRWYKYIKQSAQDPTEDPFSCWKTRRKRWAGDEGARRLPPARIKEQASSIPRSAEPENEFCLQSARDNSGKHDRRERTKKIDSGEIFSAASA
jgi:hypothetical protein